MTAITNCSGSACSRGIAESQRPSEKATSSSRAPTYMVVLDIDGVLAVGEGGNEKLDRFFGKHGHVVHAITKHYIFPGVVEFLTRRPFNSEVRQIDLI